MNKLIIVFFALLVTYSNSNGQQKSKSNYSDTKFNILFIGNSLTYTNNLPELVKKRAKKKGIKIRTEMIAFPNYAIMDHWDFSQVQQQITANKYDFVIIQQGPSSQKEGRQILIDYGKKFSSLCEINGAQLCYFMVWPSLDNYSAFDGVIKNHKDAASVNGAILIPVGEVWKEHFDLTGNFEYYSADRFHPSLKGSQIAAEVIVEYLFQK